MELCDVEKKLSKVAKVAVKQAIFAPYFPTILTKYSPILVEH